MELREAVRGRRSTARLSAPAPSDEEVLALVADAATGPDHGLLRPWRLVLVRAEARDRLGAAFAADLPAEDAEARARIAGKPLRAPLLLSIVFTARDNPKVPEWEQLAATTAVVHNLGLLLAAHGWGSIWRTGAPSRSPRVAALLGLTAGEQLLGWLYVGTPAAASAAPRPGLDARDKVAVLSPDGTVTPLVPAAVAGTAP